jgi:hypothetical protein
MVLVDIVRMMLVHLDWQLMDPTSNCRFRSLLLLDRLCLVLVDMAAVERLVAVVHRDMLAVSDIHIVAVVELVVE